jgi:phage N-6-adenine-methyltransferase
MITTGLMSSLTDQWATPQSLFDELNNEFGFTLDACASDWNHKVANYYDEAQDALMQSWTGVVWMNPPYGRTIKAWMQKAYESWRGGATVVCLVPARTDTAWWHDYAAKGEVRFIRGRIKFVDQTGNGTNSAPFPSAIVVYR